MPLISSKKIFGIIGLLYESAQAHTFEGWLDVYLKMSVMFSAGPGALSLYLPEKEQFELVVSTINDDLISQYNEYFQFISPFRNQLIKMNAGERFSRAENLPDDEFVKTEIYQDYFKKQDVFNYEYNVLFKESGKAGGISFSRPKGMKNFNEDEIKAMRLLIPHLQKAFQIYMKFSEIKREKQIMIECLGKISQSVIVLDKAGKIIFLNDSANKLVSEKDGLETGRSGVLLTNSAHETKKLQKFLTSVFEPDTERSTEFGGVLQVSRANDRRPLSILVSPFHECHNSGLYSETFALLFINDPEQKVKTVEPILSQMYGLTAAESKIAAILARGSSVSEACH
jgi:transcriptional regulator with PAS, ATPase and Fis domain